MLKEVHVVAAVIVRRDGKILCARRGNAKNSSVAWKWEFPGGKVELGEIPENALARELREEMNFEIRTITKITNVLHNYPTIKINMDAFLCVPEDEDAQFFLREHVEACWLAPESLETLDWADADKPVVEKIKSGNFA